MDARGKQIGHPKAARAAGRQAPAALRARPGAARAVIFDFDGVVADTEGLHFECFGGVLAEEGILISREDHDRRFLGINDRAGFGKAFAEIGRSLTPEACAALIARKSAAYRRRMGEVRLFPGVGEIIRELAVRVPLAIGSGGRGVEIDFVLRKNGVREHFTCIVSADDVLRSKPDPDCFFRALEELRARAPSLGGSLESEECLVIEDAPPGILAARAAGMRCLAVANSFPAGTLALADRVVPRLGDFSIGEILGGV